MAKRKKVDVDGPARGVPAEEKIARLLGLLLVKDSKNASDQVTLLRRAGFEVSDVAAMLNMTENHVRVADHHGRKKKVG
jgi:hypothetical protein